MLAETQPPTKRATKEHIQVVIGINFCILTVFTLLLKIIKINEEGKSQSQQIKSIPFGIEK